MADNHQIISGENLAQIAGILEARVDESTEEVILRIGPAERPSIVLSLSNLAADADAVISAQTSYGYFELHGFRRYVPVDPDEIIFVGEDGDRISGLVVGRGGTCSLFANVPVSIIGADYNSLEPAQLLAAMQLGLAEPVT